MPCGDCMFFKFGGLALFSVSVLACTTGPDVVQRESNAVAADSNGAKASMTQEQRVEEVPAVAKARSGSAIVNVESGKKMFTGASECDVAQTGAHKLPQCVRAVTTAEELEVIQIGEKGVKVLVE